MEVPMLRNLILTLASATAVFALGAGATAIVPAAASSSAVETLLSDMPILPVVTVVAHVPAARRGAADARSLMAGDAVQRAGVALAGRVGAGVRRVGLAVPYYAFGRNAVRPTE
jgi:hypothetical protein